MSRHYRPFAFEPLDGRALYAAVPAASPAIATVVPADVATRHVFLVGNSLTDSVNYAGLAALLGRDGTSVSLGRQAGPGYSIAQNYNLVKGYFTSGIDPADANNSNPFGNYHNAFEHFPWDVLTLQPGDRRLLKDTYDVGQPTEHEEAEVPNAMAFLRVMAANNPNGQVFLYSRPTRRTDINEDLTPTGNPFDYSTLWLRAYDEAAQHPAFIDRSAMQQLVPLLRSAQAADPTTASLPPVKLIPVGEAYYNIDQMLKAGKFAGTSLTSIYDMYRDQSHPSSGIGAYVVALTFYSSMTGIDPRGVAAPSAYGGKVADPKLAALLQQAVYDAITSPAYAGYTTELQSAPPPPPPGTATISGFTFNDSNRNGVFDGSDSKASGKTVFLDTDNDGVLDAGEKSTVTDAGGAFRFSGLGAGMYHVRRVFPNGYVPSTTPIDLTLTGGQTVSGLSIGSMTGPVTPPPPPPPPPP
ncbi:MAG: hypothetical protein JWM57_382, partial [Phycisphaerales bacterium]|nr:hypothetical protein [Phycisphaerales bacterium]